ncbi:MAG TPA: thiamine pyrophosphate-dependent dehydrogenase E1 component subunit alpha [Verrucomicrobiae bacterium]|nr:thiamine pyrophosphate-dependent dehydrogenase E1 component subunit alpha [Verrucomicrobiae bacterium]
MFETVLKPGAVGAESGDGRDTFLKAFRWMVLARVLDDKFASLYRAGKIHGGVFLGRGQEAFSAAATMALRPGDVFAPCIRDGAGRLAFGESILDAVRTYMGSVLGPMRARDGNVHRGNPQKGLLPMISHLGSMISVVNGTLWAKRQKGMKDVVGVASLGEGGTSTGAFHEALNQASVEKLPLVVVVANNQYAYSTPNSRQFACESLADRAAGYGVAGHEVNGTRLAECLACLRDAVGSARSGGGPQLIVAKLLRLCGHGEHDDAAYVDPKFKADPEFRDCLKSAEDDVLRRGWLDAAGVAQVRADAVQQVEEAVAMVQREAAPDPFREDWCALATRRLNEGHD